MFFPRLFLNHHSHSFHFPMGWKTTGEIIASYQESLQPARRRRTRRSVHDEELSWEKKINYHRWGNFHKISSLRLKAPHGMFHRKDYFNLWHIFFISTLNKKLLRKSLFFAPRERENNWRNHWLFTRDFHSFMNKCWKEEEEKCDTRNWWAWWLVAVSTEMKFFLFTVPFIQRKNFFIKV